MISRKDNPLYIGCIADDFTGAGDAASFLASNGLKTLLLIWPCEEKIIIDNYEAVVIALKSRSQDAKDAVNDSLKAADWLISHEAEKLYFKYCSTFDSTRKGNIGPVGDAILEKYHLPFTILCPALLANGRSVRNGTLYVDGVPLAESHMKNHPLNPMWDSSIENLMKEQSKYPCFVVRSEEYWDVSSLNEKIRELTERYPHFYLIPDFYEKGHGEKIVQLFKSALFWTGGSELLAHFAEKKSSGCPAAHHKSYADRNDKTGRIMLAGSCSVMTQKQVKKWILSGGRTVMIDPEEMVSGKKTIDDLVNLYLILPDEDILFYSSGSAGISDREDMDREASAVTEQCMAETADRIVGKVPVKRLIVAGGETSGAVMQALGYKAFYIGESIAPGVPILFPVDNPEMEVVLKSGNFGDEEFFINTLVNKTEEDRCLEEKKKQAVWIAHSLFERGKTSGTTANISFLHKGTVYISCSGSCFGTLEIRDFVEVPLKGLKADNLTGKAPSKELELHRTLYQSSDKIQAVIHTHSPYAVLWSCLPHKNDRDVIPHHTPYLDMKLGNVVGVAYAPPGSEELFDLFRNAVGGERGYLLDHHGPVIGGYSLINAFEALEELEQSAWLGWKLLRCNPAL